MLLHRLEMGWFFSLLKKVKLRDRTKIERIT